MIKALERGYGYPTTGGVPNEPPSQWIPSIQSENSGQGPYPFNVTAAKALSTNPVFAPFLTALPNSVQYPSDTAWANVKTKIQQTIGTAVTGSPTTVLTQLEQTATSSAS